ncbi:uncharacterized protein CELE_ZK783.7 [Caenorhabditis elegans]|uniref:Uncharacterized protein n=1 Tax=Caenorhabditis elegans TaxID=6239 RepID=C8JQP6_CAEEL|nr:Uncharacterized protein CELE_ZK783.7 [Caenorhabditis elegans]CCD65254.1 Uncharacterized protein CELE_ZK783.7 [Caenorhabditis elegans]|eukprot:NP_001254952.1 Uncharacterized protein CELE_ZK783.7 [Caenorhabditis elegans]
MKSKEEDKWRNRRTNANGVCGYLVMKYFETIDNKNHERHGTLKIYHGSQLLPCTNKTITLSWSPLPLPCVFTFLFLHVIPQM